MPFHIFFTKSLASLQKIDKLNFKETKYILLLCSVSHCVSETMIAWIMTMMTSIGKDDKGNGYDDNGNDDDDDDDDDDNDDDDEEGD